MQTLAYNSIRTNIHKKLFNKLIIIANTVPNNAIKDKFFVFVLFLIKDKAEAEKV